MANRKQQLIKQIDSKCRNLRTQELKLVKEFIEGIESGKITHVIYCCCDPTCESCPNCRPNLHPDLEVKN